MPDAPPAIQASFDELQRMATSSENALRLWEMNGDLDVGDLARRIRVPTLILHGRGDRVAPLEEGRHAARLIPNATLVELPGDNHVPIAGTPAFDQFVDEVAEFLATQG